ncbi:MAG: hypothetical protein AABX60_00235, partial [Nanoarchaeota archaeon]
MVEIRKPDFGLEEFLEDAKSNGCTVTEKHVQPYTLLQVNRQINHRKDLMPDEHGWYTLSTAPLVIMTSGPLYDYLIETS